jgi:hypothetical protein
LSLLNQDEISSEELELASCLIDFFIRNFERCYTVDPMTFNLHAHTHLVKQVEKYGPTKLSSGIEIM